MVDEAMIESVADAAVATILVQPVLSQPPAHDEGGWNYLPFAFCLLPVAYCLLSIVFCFLFFFTW